MSEIKTKKLKPEQLSSKGELVDDQEERRLVAEEDILKENPYKSPPSNETNKNIVYDREKG